MSNGAHTDWVTTEKLHQMSGYPVGGLNKLKERGKVPFGIVWKHDSLKKIIWNVKAFEQWQQGTLVLNQDQKAA